MGNAAAVQQSPYILHTICQEGNAELLHQVLSLTTLDVNRLDEEGYTPIARAVESGSTDCVRILLECGADTSIGDNQGVLPLHRAAQYGRSECMKLLLRSTGEFSHVNVATLDGSTPLHFAAAGGHAHACLILLQRGADIAATDSDGETPLHLAVEFGHQDCARFLLDNGAPQRWDGPDSSPLHKAIVHLTADSTACAMLLLDKRGEWAQYDLTGRTPLHWASGAGNAALVEYILDHGVDPNVPDRLAGRTPLFYAVTSASKATVDVLLQRGADVLARDSTAERRTPLQFLQYVVESQPKDEYDHLRDVRLASAEMLAAIREKPFKAVNRVVRKLETQRILADLLARENRLLQERLDAQERQMADLRVSKQSAEQAAAVAQSALERVGEAVRAADAAAASSEVGSRPGTARTEDSVDEFLRTGRMRSFRGRPTSARLAGLSAAGRRSVSPPQLNPTAIGLASGAASSGAGSPGVSGRRSASSWRGASTSPGLAGTATEGAAAAHPPRSAQTRHSDVMGMHVRAGAIDHEDLVVMSPRRSLAQIGQASVLRPLRFLKEVERNMALRNLWSRPTGT